MNREYRTLGASARAENVRPPIRMGRERSGMSQECMAEYLDVDPRTLRRWESGDDPTPDDAMAMVAELVGSPYLLYLHYKTRYEISDDILPPVEEVSLSQAVCQLLTELAALEANGVAGQLLAMAADGMLDTSEAADFAFVMAKLDGVRRAVEMLRYSRKGGPQ